MNHRRRVLVRAIGAAGATSLAGWPWKSAFAEPPPETTTIRITSDYAACLAPQYVAEELLRLEGFTQVTYVGVPSSDPTNIGLLRDGKADLTMDAVTALVPALDAGHPITVLAGIHSGCYELFANERIRTIRDLKQRSVAIRVLGDDLHVYVASMAAYIGMDPNKDIRWIEGRTGDAAMRLFIDGKADAFLGFPPHPQQLRAQKVGHVIVNTTRERPWSQYFCCMLAGRQEFVRSHPVATKRALRAILKATDMCIRDPERVARYVVSKGHEPNYAIALEVLKDVSYNAWRTFDPESTLRFYLLRLHEVGMIKSDPKKLIAQGTDWRFLGEIKRELKA